MLDVLDTLEDSFESSELRALVLSHIAQLCFIEKKYDEAIEKYDKSLSVIQNSKNQQQDRNSNSQALEAEILHGKGTIYFNKGEEDIALECFEKSKAISETERITSGEISCSYHIANIYRNKGNYGDALNLLNTVLLIAKEVGYKSLIAELLHGLGNVYYDKREYDKALDFFRERLSIEKSLATNRV